MKACLMIFVLCLAASCGPARVEYRTILPDLPVALRTPVAVPDRRAETLADVGVILTDHVQALDAANGRIIATDCIWRAAEAGGAQGSCI